MYQIDLGIYLGIAKCKSITLSNGRSDNKQNRFRTGEECVCEKICLRIGLPLACGSVLGFANCFYIQDLVLQWCLNKRRNKCK